MNVAKTNAHTHLDLTFATDYCPEDRTGFPVWIDKILGVRKDTDLSKYQTAVDNGIKLLKQSGTTHVGDIATDVSTFYKLQDAGLGGIVFFEIIGINKQNAENSLDVAMQAVKKILGSGPCNSLFPGISIHAPYSVHPDVIVSASAEAKSLGIPVCIHVAESLEESELVHSGTGDLAAVFQKHNLQTMTGCKKSPVRYLDRLSALGENVFLVHAVHIDLVDVQVIKSRGCKVITCPESNCRLGCGVCDVGQFIINGIDTYAGTDSLGSCKTLDVAAQKGMTTEIAKLLSKPLVWR